MLIRGELDAVIGVDVDHPDVAPLVPEPEEAASLRCGSVPSSDQPPVVVKDEVLRRYPSVASAVRCIPGGQAALCISAARRRRVLTWTGCTPRCCRPPADPPYGVEPSRPMLETLMEFALAQRILARPVVIDEMFAA
jgi:4,5-dihydroxyphthalate decarboxylase